MIRPFLVPSVGMPFAVAIVDKTRVFRFSNRSNPLLMGSSTKPPHQIHERLLECVLLLPLRETGAVVRPHEDTKDPAHAICTWRLASSFNCPGLAG